VGTTVENADRLLDIWIKVLSQSEHTQRLLLDGKWQGSTEVIPPRNPAYLPYLSSLIPLPVNPSRNPSLNPVPDPFFVH
jgi:DASH complex subunit Duo1